MGQHARHRSRALATALLVAALASIAACGGGDDKSTSTNAKNASGATTITWWDYFGYSDAGNQAINGMIAAYEKSHPGVKIKRTSYA